MASKLRKLAGEAFKEGVRGHSVIVVGPDPLARPRLTLEEIGQALAEHIRFEAKHGRCSCTEALTHIRDQLSAYRLKHGGP
jgi:hypothetical protein